MHTHKLWFFVLFIMLTAGNALANSHLNVVGLYLNGKSSEKMLDILIDQDQHLLKVSDLIELAQVPHQFQDNKLVFDTPIGSATLDMSDVKNVEDDQFVNIKALKQISVQAAFIQRQFALALNIPWLDHIGQTVPNKKGKKLKADYFAPFAGVSSAEISANADHDIDKETTDFSTQIELAGQLSKGSWGVGLSTDQSESISVDDLYWSRFNKNHAVRAGLNSSNYGTGTSGSAYSGLQYAYSNKGIYSHISDSSGVDSQLLRTNRDYTQDISGNGPPGGIVELRINNRPVARLRIGFDGKYNFTNLNLGRYFDRKVELFLYEYSVAQQPIRTIDLSKLRKPEGVSTKELFLQAGVGTEGNQFNTPEEEHSYNYFNAKYGINNQLTLEAGAQQKGSDDQADSYLGVIANLGQYVVATVGYVKQPGESQAWLASAYAEKGNTQASYKGRVTESTDSSGQVLTDHRFDLDRQINSEYTLVLAGRHIDNALEPSENESYLLPGVHWQPSKNQHYSLLPSGNEYQFNAYWAVNEYTNVAFDANRDNYVLSANHDFNNDTTIDAAYGVARDSELTFSRVGVNHYFENDYSHALSVNVGHSSGQTGYYVNWSKSLNQTTRVQLTYSQDYVGGFLQQTDDAGNELISTGDNRILLSVHTTLSKFGGKWQPRYSNIGSKRGAIGGSVIDKTGNPIDTQAIRFKVGNQRVTANNDSNGQFSIGNLPPGIYPITLSDHDLPIEYANNRKTYFAEVAPGATTTVDITLTQSFGVSGQIYQQDIVLPNAKIYIFMNDKLVDTSQTDEYGFYQVLSLAPGVYELRSQGQSRPFTITDDYLFGVDLHF